MMHRKKCNFDCKTITERADDGIDTHRMTVLFEWKPNITEEQIVRRNSRRESEKEIKRESRQS